MMKDLVWNLDDLFKSKEDFYLAIESVRERTLEFSKYKNTELNSDSLFLILNEKWDIKDITNDIWVYGNLVYYKDINNQECIEMKRVADEFNNEVNLSVKFVDLMILELGKDKVNDFILENKELEVYKLFLDNLFRMESHIQGDDVNQKVKSNVDNINDEIGKYNELVKSINYDSILIDGESTPLNSSNLAKFLASRDRNTRRQAYLSVNNSYLKESDKFASILDSLFKTRVDNAFLEGYSSVLEKVLFEENISLSVIDSLLKSVNDKLPLMQRYLDLKSKFICVSEPHLYDFNVPMDNNLKFSFSLEESISIVKKALAPLGEDYLRVVDLLLDGHIDGSVDEKKHQSITFSWNVYSFLNFRGSYVDLKNLVHELGHIVNYYLSKGNVPFLYEDSTVFVGETASIVNEILLNRYLYNNANSFDEKVFYLSKEIENYFTSVFKQTMYTEFENILYDIVKSNSLSSDVLTDIYSKLIHKYYGSNVVYDRESYFEWTRLGHLYRWSYYPYKYATGLLIASSVVNSLVDEKSLSSDKYLGFLSSGSSMYSLDLLKILDIDLSDESVLVKGFSVLEKDIEYLENALKLEK